MHTDDLGVAIEALKRGIIPTHVNAISQKILVEQLPLLVSCVFIEI